jgi:hypothetical protein
LSASCGHDHSCSSSRENKCKVAAKSAGGNCHESNAAFPI